MVDGSEPIGGVGQTNSGQGTVEENVGTTTTVGQSTTANVPDVRTDVFKCTNNNSLAKRGNKSKFSGCKKKMFELSGSICVSETQMGDLCEGDEEVGDGYDTAVTN